MTSEIFKGIASAKGIAFLIVAWGIPVAFTMSIWWLFAASDFAVWVPYESTKPLRDLGLSAGWLFLLTWGALTLMMGVNSRSFFRLYEGYVFPRFVADRRSRRYWLLRESLRLRDRVTVYEDRVSSGQKPPSDMPTLAELRAAESKVVDELSHERGMFGRMMQRNPFRVVVNWRDLPSSEANMAPTLFGNRMRAFERYGNDRFGLDIIILWHEFTAASEDHVRDQINSARQGVELFLASSVCSVFLTLGLTFSLVLKLVRGDFSFPLLIATLLAGIVAWLSYVKAVDEVAEWASAVRSLVNVNRSKVAKFLGYTLPPAIIEEREFWRALTGFVRNGGVAWEKRLNKFSASVTSAVSRCPGCSVPIMGVPDPTNGSDSTSPRSAD